MLFRSPFAPALARFRHRSVLGKVATVAVFCALAWCGGGKNAGGRGGDGSRGDAETRRAGGAGFGSTVTTAYEQKLVPPNPVNPVNPVKNNHCAPVPLCELYLLAADSASPEPLRRAAHFTLQGSDPLDPRDFDMPEIRACGLRGDCV